MASSISQNTIQCYQTKTSTSNIAITILDFRKHMLEQTPKLCSDTWTWEPQLTPLFKYNHKIYPDIFLNRVEHENWKVYIQDSLANNSDIKEETLTTFKQLLEFTTAKIEAINSGVLNPFVD